MIEKFFEKDPYDFLDEFDEDIAIHLGDVAVVHYKTDEPNKISIAKPDGSLFIPLAYGSNLSQASLFTHVEKNADAYVHFLSKVKNFFEKQTMIHYGSLIQDEYVESRRSEFHNESLSCFNQMLFNHALSDVAYKSSSTMDLLLEIATSQTTPECTFEALAKVLHYGAHTFKDAYVHCATVCGYSSKDYPHYESLRKNLVRSLLNE